MALSLRPLIHNGYISKTLRTVQIGTMTTGEWIGEDLLIMEDPTYNTYEYSAIAQTKLETYMINFQDIFKIPQVSREQMEAVSRLRRKLIVQRVLNLYRNLKSIKTKLEVGDDEKNH